mgnify:CR=1 FL=1
MLRATGVVRSSAPQIRQSWAGGMHASPLRSFFDCTSRIVLLLVKQLLFQGLTAVEPYAGPATLHLRY